MKARMLIELASETEQHYWTRLLAATHALERLEHHAHWVSKGSNYYGDHLLFERLYKETGEDVDGIAEKAIGTTGDSSLVAPVGTCMLVTEYLTTWTQEDDLTARTLNAERGYIELVSSMKLDFENDGALTDGIDNFLQGLADKHESHVYLLQQRSA